MDPNKTSKLIAMTVLDTKDEIDEKFDKQAAVVDALTNGLSEKDAYDALQSHVCKGNQQHDEVIMGLYHTIMTVPPQAVRAYRDITLIAKDGLVKVLSATHQILYEKWSKLQDSPRKQLMWIIRQLVKTGVNGTDHVVHSAVRQIAGGDVSPQNVWLAEALLDILVDHRDWLDKFPALMTMIVYSYLRVMVDHNSPSLANLRQREVDFTISLLREKWTECIQIGRDLVRLLQDVARIPEFEKLWEDILFDPTTLAPSFKGVEQLLSMRTSKKYFMVRLTPDMENKLAFLTTKVKFGQQKRYQDWFQKQYLSTPESQSLRCDLIRYICAVIHPTNEILCSDIIPRWAVIGWLLTTCTTNVVASNAKLALFYDWLMFVAERDSIMNIEPGILVMYHSMRPHPAITATLLDFMCRIMHNFHMPMSGAIKSGIYSALETILTKKVLPSLAPLFDNPKLDIELRIKLKENFPDFCSFDIYDIDLKELLGGGNNKEVVDLDDAEVEGTIAELNDSSLSDVHAEFSDDEEEYTPEVEPTLLKNDTKFRPIKDPPKILPTVDISKDLDNIDNEDIKQCVLDLEHESGNELKCEMMERLIQTIIQNEDEFDQDLASKTAVCLSHLLDSHFHTTLFPTTVDEETIEDSIGSPLFVIYRNLCQTDDEDPSRQYILLLLEEMYIRQPKIGFHFLYFLKVSKMQTEGKMAPYKDFCKNMEKDLDECLMSDLQLCQEDDVRLFTFLIPDVYSQFSNIAIGSSDLLHLIVSCVDCTQLQDLICEILRGHLIMFKKDSFLSLLNASLEWESIEQCFLWQLISAHNIPVEHIMPILPKLEFNAHAEALTSIMIQLKQESPSQEILRPLLCRECKKHDLFTVSVLKYWAKEYEDKLADLLYSQLTRSTSTPNRKRQRNQPSNAKTKDQPSVEQILAHLEHLRQTCRNISFLTHEQLQQALQQIQTTATEAQKTRYSDLLALAEEFDDLRAPTRVLRSVPSRRAAAASGGKTTSKGKKSLADDSDSETESSSDDDDIIKPRPKKLKKTSLLDEDD